MSHHKNVQKVTKSLLCCPTLSLSLLFAVLLSLSRLRYVAHK